MYEEHFGLAERPFSISPDPRYLYMSFRHREALAHLLYSVKGEGSFVLLTGEIGTGKTTICRCFLAQLPDNCDVAFIANPRLSVPELLSTICEELRIPADGNTGIKPFIDRINAHLLEANARGRATVLIIDEAQNLAADVLEQMRLLTNLETNERKLLQIVLIGQPQLHDLLARPELKQLAQRIAARYHLEPLSRDEVAEYVQHRLATAGIRRAVFPTSTMGLIFRLSGGVPRLINLVCDRALLGAYAQRRERIDSHILNRAAREVFGEARLPRWLPKRIAFAVLGLLSSAAALSAAYVHYGEALPAGSAFQRDARADSPRPESRTAAALSAPSPSPPAPAAAMPLEALPWPDSVPRRYSEGLAYQALFRQWGFEVEAAAVADPCRRAESLGLGCLSGRGGLDDLRRLNLPAVLSLDDEHGEEFQAALTVLQGDTAIMIAGGQSRLVSMRALAAQWSGGYTLFWRAPPDYHGAIGPGSRGPAIEWLDAALAKARGEPSPANNHPRFDDAFVQRIKQFQLAEGLAPDGIVGPQTLIHLDVTVGGRSPRLARPKEE